MSSLSFEQLEVFGLRETLNSGHLNCFLAAKWMVRMERVWDRSQFKLPCHSV